MYLYSFSCTFFGIYNNLTQPTESPHDYTSFYILLFTFLGGYLMPIFLHCSFIANSFWKTFLRGFLAYIIWTPSYLVIFPIFSFANVDDVSWGNLDTANPTFKEEKVKNLKFFKFSFFTLFLIVNCVIIIWFTQTITIDNYNRILLIKIIAYILVGVMLIKGIFSMIDILIFLCCERTKRDGAGSALPGQKSFLTNQKSNQELLGKKTVKIEEEKDPNYIGVKIEENKELKGDYSAVKIEDNHKENEVKNGNYDKNKGDEEQLDKSSHKSKKKLSIVVENKDIEIKIKDQERKEEEEKNSRLSK